jgi:predicted phage terminase large subunit-like protein
MTTTQQVRGQLAMEELLRRWEYAKTVRNKCRRSLIFLCNQVLGYKDVNWEIHKDLINNLQKFPNNAEDVLDNHGQCTVIPNKNLWELETYQGGQSTRNTLSLYPRGHLKTTIITIAHTIQWIVNYPNVRILISTATGDQCKKMLLEIKSHFQYNKVFRHFFADFCPPAKKAADFGSQEEFTVPNRTVHRKEPTVSTCSVGKVIAGSHYEVIKNSDLVDKENVKTPGQIADVISHFGYLNPLLERSEIHPHNGWVDVEGTRYDFGDLYGRLLESGTYRVIVRPRDDEESVWPARFPPEELARIEKEVGPWIYSAQYRNKCIPPEGGLCDPKDIVFLPRSVINNILPTLRVHCTVDLHGMEPAKNNNDFSVLNVHGFDRNGRMYVVDVRRGRFSPFQVIEHIFDIQARWNPIDFKVEKDAHARVLLPFFQREASKRQKFPILAAIPRNTHISKQQRIRGLQPWFRNGIIRFSDDLSAKSEIIQEIMRFPSQSAGVHDDFLDTCADAMTNQEGEVNDDVVADSYLDPQSIFGMEKPRNRFIGFREGGAEQWLYGNEEEKGAYAPTGVL